MDVPFAEDFSIPADKEAVSREGRLNWKLPEQCSDTYTTLSKSRQRLPVSKSKGRLTKFRNIQNYWCTLDNRYIPSVYRFTSNPVQDILKSYQIHQPHACFRKFLEFLLEHAPKLSDLSESDECLRSVNLLISPQKVNCMLTATVSVLKMARNTDFYP